MGSITANNTSPMSRRLLYRLVGMLIAFPMALSAQTYKLDIQVRDMGQDTCILAYHFGDKQYIKDTVYSDARGRMSYTTEEPLKEGLYYLVLPNRNFLEFITDQKTLNLSTSYDDVIQDMDPGDSKENQIFYGFLKYSELRGQKAADLRTMIKTAEDEKEEKKLRKDLQKINEEIQEYKKGVIEDHPRSFVATFFEASREPELPEPKKLANGKVDSTYPYRWYRQHYLDNVDFSDERLLRTPILHNRMMRYLDKIVMRHPDTLIEAVKMITARASGNDEVYKYVVHKLTSKYERSKYMGMDAVFVHLVENHYANGRADWVSEENMTKIVQRARQIKPTLLGKVAPQIQLKDTEGQARRLHNVSADYTVVYIWDPDCGHCKKATPKLKKIYDKYDRETLEVFAVNNALEKEKWLKFIDKHNLNWINVADFEMEGSYRAYYDVRSTPMVFLLDENKEILAKKISVEQLDDLLERMTSQKSKS